MYFNWRRFLADSYHALFPGRDPHLRITGHRARVLVMFFLCMLWMVGGGRLGLLLDYLLFPWFRRTPVRGPVFIVGNFRSGSTLLHRILATSPNFTAMKTWEIYFAPSITQRKFWRGFWIVDGWFGSPIRRRILAAQDERLGAVDMHRIRLDEPEEDEALFLYLWDSLFNWFFMPRDAAENPYWRFDEAVPTWRRRKAMAFYREVIRRHLALQPEGAVYLSKSPSFTARLRSLVETFPDARIIELARHPADCVVSTAGWLSYAWHYFASPVERFPFLPTVLEMCRTWYLRPRSALAGHGARHRTIRYEDLVLHPVAQVEDTLRAFGIPVSGPLHEGLVRLEASADPGRTHSHTLEELGLSRDEAHRFFADVLERFGYDD
jgi:hypothetical protein